MADQTSVKYFKVKVPKEWVRSVIDPHTFEEVFLKLYPHKDILYRDLPPYMIHPTEGGWFMFEDEMEALTFKLTYL